MVSMSAQRTKLTDSGSANLALMFPQVAENYATLPRDLPKTNIDGSEFSLTQNRPFAALYHWLCSDDQILAADAHLRSEL